LQSRPARAERPYLKNIQRKQAGILEFKFQYWDPPATKKKKKNCLRNNLKKFFLSLRELVPGSRAQPPNYLCSTMGCGCVCVCVGRRGSEREAENAHRNTEIEHPSLWADDGVRGWGSIWHLWPQPSGLPKPAEDNLGSAGCPWLEY
jgi:hypothetical protein